MEPVAEVSMLGRIYGAMLDLLGRRPRPPQALLPVRADWNCPGGPRPHLVELFHVEALHGRFRDPVDIHRCAICGSAYLCQQSEVNDWGSSGGDYYRVTRRWRPLEDAEFSAARSDRDYVPRSAVEFTDDSGWRSEG